VVSLLLRRAADAGPPPTSPRKPWPPSAASWARTSTRRTGSACPSADAEFDSRGRGGHARARRGRRAIRGRAGPHHAPPAGSLVVNTPHLKHSRAAAGAARPRGPRRTRNTGTGAPGTPQRAWARCSLPASRWESHHTYSRVLLGGGGHRDQRRPRRPRKEVLGQGMVVTGDDVSRHRKLFPRAYGAIYPAVWLVARPRSPGAGIGLHADRDRAAARLSGAQAIRTLRGPARDRRRRHGPRVPMLRPDDEAHRPRSRR
jgi:hypothetical protein